MWWLGNGVDYISEPITAVFIAGTNRTSVDVPVTRDGIAEGSEMFDLTFTIPSTVKAVIPGSVTRAVGTILDIESKYGNLNKYIHYLMIHYCQILLWASLRKLTLLMRMIDSYNSCCYSVFHHQLLLMYQLMILATLQLVNKYIPYFLLPCHI